MEIMNNIRSRRIITLIMAIVMVIGLASTSFAAFSDISAGHWSEDYVNNLSERGIISGRADGTFGPHEPILRQHVAKMIALALELELGDGTTVFNDVKDGNEFAEYIAATNEAGYFKGVSANEFGWGNNITRRQIANVIVRAFDLEMGPEEVKFEDINFATDKEAENNIKILASNGIISGYENGTEFRPNVTATRAQFAKMLVEAEAVANKEPEELEVVSVSAINARQMQVKFGKAVDPNTVLNSDGTFKANVVKVDATDMNIAGYEGEFDTDNKVLTIYNKTGSAWVKDTAYTVAVDNVKDIAANEVPKFATVVTLKDSVVPTIVSATAITNADKTKNVTVKFSEPVNFTAVEVNDKLATAVAKNVNYSDEWTLTSADDLEAGKTYNVEFSGLSDLLGNSAAVSTTTVTVVKDTVKPVPTLNVTGENKFNIVFDKEMNTSVDVTSVRVTTIIDGTETIVSLSGLPTFKADKKTLEVTLANVPFQSSTEASRELKVTVSGLNDSLGNTMSAYEGKITVTRDATKPSIVSVAQTPGAYDKVDVTFSEEVSAVTSGANLSDIFKLTDTSGNAVKNASNADITVTGTATVTSLGLNSNNKVTFTLSDSIIKDGTYRIVLVQNTVKDTANIANFNNAQVIPFAFKAAQTPAAPQLKATINATTDAGGLTPTDSTASNRKVAILFDQDDVVNGIDAATGTYKAGAADNPINYTLNGQQLPEGTVVTFSNNDVNNSDNDVVVLDFSSVADNKLPTAFKEGGTINVSVGSVKTVAGSTVSYTAKTLNIVDKTAPTIKEAFLTGTAGDYKLTVVFSETMNVVDESDFELTDGTNAATLGTANISTTDAKRVEFDVTQGSMSVSGPITFKTVVTGSLSGNTVDKATVANAIAEDTTGVTVTNYAQ